VVVAEVVETFAVFSGTVEAAPKVASPAPAGDTADVRLSGPSADTFCSSDVPAIVPVGKVVVAEVVSLDTACVGAVFSTSVAPGVDSCEAS
jgi:hypothetical protein